MSTSARGADPSAGYTYNLIVSMFSKVFVVLNMIVMFIVLGTSSSHVHFCCHEFTVIFLD